MVVKRKEGSRILKGDEKGLFCECLRTKKRNHIEDCPKLKYFIKRMIKLGMLEVPKSVKKEQIVNMVL